MHETTAQTVPNAVTIPWSVKIEGLGVRVNVERWTFKFTPLRVALIGFIAIAGLAMIYRLIMGLEAVTNLNDQWPWGLWKAIAVFSAIALAGGGYFTAFLAHVCNIEKLKPLGRMTLAVSLLGYVLGLLGLFLEIGRWFNFWPPFYSWGFESPMFETFLCISAYTVVQTFEMAEIATEKIFRFAHKFLVMAFPFLVCVGVMLPTMHQSTLGTLYILAAGKLSPLWWSPIIFFHFLLSSLYVGPATVAVVAVFNEFSFRRRVPMEPMVYLARIGGWLMLFGLVLRLGDIVWNGNLGLAFNGSTHSCLFLAEIVLGLVIPLAIVFSPFIATRFGLITFGVLGSFGVLFNRTNTVIAGMWQDAGIAYYPSALEYLILGGMIAIAVLIYIIFCENFNILDV